MLFCYCIQYYVCVYNDFVFYFMKTLCTGFKGLLAANVGLRKMEQPFNQQYQLAPVVNSLWAATAPAPIETERLMGEEADVIIIGAGIVGLSMALALQEQGLKSVVVEANEIGWGASGRNNGQVIPGLKLDPDEVIKQLGEQSGNALVALSGGAPDLVFSLVEKHKIECEAVQHGWIQPAPSKKACAQIQRRYQQWERLGAKVEMLPTKGLKERLGTDWYQSAWLDHRGGSVNPLAYVRGLAKAAKSAGARIFTQSPMDRFSQQGNAWLAAGKTGSVKGRYLMICTNAYKQNFNRPLLRSIVPVRTAQIASEVLTKNQWQAILPAGEAASDSSNLLTSFRITKDKRLVMGGAYATGGDETELLFEKLKTAAKNRFPWLGSIKWDYQWSGYLAITDSHLPHIFKLGEGCYAPIGCNGRGIAMSTQLGTLLANKIANNALEQSVVPLSGPQPIAFHGFRNIGITTTVLWNQFLDKVEK